ncbi:8-amino-7-oxononanoate synthase [Virgisporangium aliadipatigenens]|uniref:8-amino-7-oxononanoate synthase n=1 Tax=Virgisporangium aliadipatigenens TaxID=741659 RepID=A0A8J3YWT3_9ACTN|nr:8-amino-7-oxononanoate synthase [Virgisporangium aliadipatigenens]GIJ52038.1 8-amino-7-oxononanoate synthase [Virgisporangium aliadipatigenens]
MTTFDDMHVISERRAAAGLRRTLRPRPPGDTVIDLAGNDYLGLARHPEVISAATAALAAYGLGATGSRLVRGSTEEHARLEAELAAWLGAPAALVYSSGYLANLGAIRALTHRPGTLVLSDAHNHASIVDGCRFAVRDGAELRVFPHKNVDAVRAALASHDGPAVVITESVFSVYGDLAPLRDLHEACRAAGAVLMVDDAHALGLHGPSGAGAVAASALTGERHLVLTGTLSKAFGAAGGVIAGPPELHRYLVDTGRTFIYDTGLPPAVAAGARAALRLIRTGTELRSELASRAAELVARLRAAGLTVTDPAAGVVAVDAAGPEEAVAWASACAARGVAVGCFRPPSTPDGRSRLRLTINTGVPREDFAKALDVIVQEARGPR